MRIATTANWGVRVRHCGCALPAALAACLGCGSLPGDVLPNEATRPVDTDRFELLARFVHISDAQLVDEESPGRLTSAASLDSYFEAGAWRPHEAYSTQLLDGIVRTVNKLHVAQGKIDFLVHTGDAIDNAQLNELEWFITALDGGEINPRTGPDDRSAGQMPEPLLDPHHPFEAQGLYRQGVHGDAPTVGWYSLLGNHDRFAAGNFPIVTNLLGQRTSPLPLENRIGLFLPRELNPVGSIALAPITPAHPGPPPELSTPEFVRANPRRRFITDSDFVEAHLRSRSSPPGHGFSTSARRRTWFSVSPVPGVRLIALNSATPLLEQPTLAYSEGAISLPQRSFLKDELGKARRRGEVVVVATHHSSEALEPVNGTSLTARALIDLLNGYRCVKLHLAAHLHRNRVIDRGGYLEILTGSTLDAPQEGRLIEIWQADDEVQLRYWMFSHLDNIEPPDEAHVDLFDDSLLPLRRIAAELAGVPSM
ncbi:MAG: metallophosphoesterase [Planctomycetota bacterium]|jgi:3',5'-cyclic AMP phosphodiesterase CpdA